MKRIKEGRILISLSLTNGPCGLNRRYRDFEGKCGPKTTDRRPMHSKESFPLHPQNAVCTSVEVVPLHPCGCAYRRVARLRILFTACSSRPLAYCKHDSR